MTPRPAAVRRRELYDLSIDRLQAIYARLSGHLIGDVRADWPTSNPRSQRALVDMIVYAETRHG